MVCELYLNIAIIKRELVEEKLSTSRQLCATPRCATQDERIGTVSQGQELGKQAGTSLSQKQQTDEQAYGPSGGRRAL